MGDVADIYGAPVSSRGGRLKNLDGSTHLLCLGYSKEKPNLRGRIFEYFKRTSLFGARVQWDERMGDIARVSGPKVLVLFKVAGIA